MNLRRCNDCKRRKPLSAFGSNRARQDGINLYCKVCCAADMKARRAAAKKIAPARKEMVVAAAKLSTAEKVLIAITRGHRTREAIRAVTKLDEDLVCDVLAELAFDYSAIRIVRRGEEREFHLNQKAA